jgi:ankyrin repeat protein
LLTSKKKKKKRIDPRLVEATLNGNVIELQRLLQQDSLLLERGFVAVYPETTLHVAAMGGQTEFVRELLKQFKPDFATRLDKEGAIHIASANGFVETVREILKFSPELSLLKSNDGRTSLHCAAVTRRVQVIRELVDFFPDCIKDVTPRGETALQIAMKYSEFEAFDAMFDRDVLGGGASVTEICL